MPHRLKQFADAKLAEEAFSILLMTYGLFPFVGIHRSGAFSVLLLISVFSGVDTICAKDNNFIFKMILNEKNNHRIIQC